MVGQKREKTLDKNSLSNAQSLTKTSVKKPGIHRSTGFI